VDDLKELLADGFTEFGRSGRVFDKKAVIGRIQKDETDKMNLSDFKVVIFGAGHNFRRHIVRQKRKLRSKKAIP